MKTLNKKAPPVNLNLNVRGLRVSATLQINEVSDRLHREGKKIYKLGLGQSPFPVPNPVCEELKANAHQKAYLPVKGLRELRGAVADYYRRSEGVDYNPDSILVGPGSKELMFILQLVYYGDLLIPTPSWVSYAPQAHIIGRHIRWLPTSINNCWKLMPEEIERHCQSDPDRPRLVILNYPNNPSGCTYTSDELKEIARVAKKYSLVVLSDEIYAELHHQGRNVSIARYYPEGTIIGGGLSKWCGAGGWRLGTFAFPRSLNWLLDAMASVASETYTSTSAPIQYAAVRAYSGGLEIEEYLANSRRILKALGKYMARRLQKMGVSVSDPRGAFYLFPNFNALRPLMKERGILTSRDLCAELLNETGVATIPGEAFGRPAEELTLRISYVDFDGARALVAAAQEPDKPLNSSFLNQYCTNCVEAMDQIASFLKK